MAMPDGSQRKACLPVALALVGVSPKSQLRMIYPEKAWRRARGSPGLTLDLQLVLHQMPHLGKLTNMLLTWDKWQGTRLLSSGRVPLLTRNWGCCLRTPWVSFLMCGVRPAPYTGVMCPGCPSVAAGSSGVGVTVLGCGVEEDLDGGLVPPTPTPVQSGWGLGARAAATLPSAE